MPPTRNPPARSSQRRSSIQDDTPTRTRSSRGAPATTKSKTETTDAVASRQSPHRLSPTITRKTTRSASNISSQPSFADAAPEVYASYEEPYFMVFGLSREFFDGLKRHHGKLPKQRKSLQSASQDSPSSGENSEPEEDSADESEESADARPVMSHSAPRGRGRGRGGRGGRGRGGRGRGRGGRGRGGLVRAISPTRSRPSRSAAPVFPLTEEDDGLSNQTTPNGDGLASPLPDEDEQMTDASEPTNGILLDVDVDSDLEAGSIGNVHLESMTPAGSPPSTTTPQGSPPKNLLNAILDGTYTPSLIAQPEPKAPKNATRAKIPKISLTTNSASQTPRDLASTPADNLRLLDPKDDVLTEEDLPGPWLEYFHPQPLNDCEDMADYLLQRKYQAMSDVNKIIAALNKFPAAQRSTDNLYVLAQNAQYILERWQDEYLELDARTAPHMHPPKKACTSGRTPVGEQLYEDTKEADLYGYTFDPKKLPGCQDPWAQRPGAEKSSGRELRTRRARDMLDSAAASEEEEEDNDGRSRRQRKPPRKFDGTDVVTGATTPKKHSGWGGARKKGVSRFALQASETPEPDSRPVKRARTAAASALHQRLVHESVREGSVATTSGDEGSSTMDVEEYTDTYTKRGRPPGSKNTGRRSDFGVKKGPRKKASDLNTPVPSAHGPNAPPPALQSLSAGQGQFSIDPQPFLDAHPLPAPNSAETVFQATPQPAAAQDGTLVHPNESSTPDAYMLTAPLSQYTNNQVEDSAPPPGSRRKPRVKSEKRSQSMTIWWAERKARKKEQDEKEGKPPKPTTSRSNSSSGRRGGRAGAGPSATATPVSTPPEAQRPSPVHHQDHHYTPDAYTMHGSLPPLTAPSPHLTYASAPLHHPMLLQYSPLAAIPSGSFSGFSGPPPLHSQFGPRVLAPAPQQLSAYPSPYGPQSPAGPRPRSSGRNGPPPLAPAPPQHFSPYAPVSMSREMPFKVMVPGPPPHDDRRGSR